MTDFTIIRRSLTSRLFSTVTTAITVAVAVGLMLTLLSLRDAGRKSFERGSGNAHLLISRDASPLTAVLNGLFYANSPQRAILWPEYESLVGSMPIDWSVPTQLGDGFRGMPVLATTGDFFRKFKPAEGTEWSAREGRAFEKDFEIVAGSEAAKLAGLRIGDKIHLTHGVGKTVTANGEVHMPHEHAEFEFEVVGILNPTGTAHDRALFINLMSTWILHAHDRREDASPGVEVSRTTPAEVLPDDKKITGILLGLPTRPGSNVPVNLPVVFDTIRRQGAFTVAQPAQEIDRLFAIVGSIDQVFVAMAAVVLGSSAIAIMLALYNSMEQRRRQIAVLRVLGCSRVRIFGLIVTESAILGAVGAIAGALLCFVGLRVTVGVIKENQGIVIEPSVVPAIAAAVLLAAILLAALAGLVPAIMAYRTPVAKNLKPLG